MTISSTTVKVSYSGNGSTTVFAYTFKILDDDEIQVIIRSSTGTETVKTKTTHYTVSGVGSSGGGNITFLTAPTATQTVVLRRLTTQTQETDYVANDPFPADSHEEALDRVTMVAQEIQEELGRAIKLSKTNTMTSTEFTVAAADRANKILAFDTNGEISVTQELGTYKGNWTTATAYYGRDIVKDTSNNNIYIANTAHTSTGSQPISTNADVAKWDLLVDAASASTYANSAANHAANSSNFANNSSNSANTSANHSANSSNFANNSSNSASNAANSEAGVAANAANSSNFANNSSNSANSAANHSANSSNFANNSSNSANNSSNSSNSSANHSANSSNFANNSSNSANTSANHASNSSNHSANSSNFANNSSNSANTSANHASNSSNHASNSSNHASNSSNHSANSSNFANNSSNHSSNASNAANAANSARDAALVAADNFDDVYLGSKASDPTLDNDGDALTAGDLYYNSVGTVLKYYTGSAWVSITSGGITDLVQDTTPQLGGALDVNTFSITSTSNGNITLQPNGTGDVVLSADTVKIGDANTDAVLTTDGTGDITISTNSGSNSGTVKIFDGVNGNIEITPNGSGVVKLDGLSYPIADGSANQVLQTNGSGVLSFATLTADGTADWDTTVKTTNFTATANKGYFLNTTSGEITVTLPTSPSAGDEVIIVDYAGTFATNNLIITSTPKINGSTNDVKLTTNREATRLVYIDSTQGWLAYSGVNEGTAPSLTDNPPTYSVDFLVIAGGGGGANYGGGGAGGYRNSYSTESSGGGGSSETVLTFVAGTVYTVTVGGPGAGGAGLGSNGSNSVISGTGITTITSTGGGGGAALATAGSGGSGGGSADSGRGGAVGSGTANQGFAGALGDSDSAVYTIGGGGGGASSDGVAATSSAAGNGGNGLSSSITGSSVGRGGGGGGGGTAAKTAGTGSSGGGNGQTSGTGTAGTANTGGGGGAKESGSGFAGGKGVVILRMPDANYSGTTTGSPTVTQAVGGTDTVIVFNDSGSITG